MIPNTFSIKSNDFTMTFGNKFHSKSINKWHARWNVSFCLHSKRHNALRCPKTPQRRPPGSPRRTQSAPKTAPRRLQDGPRHTQDGPNCAQLLLRPPRSPASFDFGPSGPRFWTLQTSIFDHLFSFWRGGGDAALLRVGSAAPGLVPAHGVQSPLP